MSHGIGHGEDSDDGAQRVGGAHASPDEGGQGSGPGTDAREPGHVSPDEPVASMPWFAPEWQPGPDDQAQSAVQIEQPDPVQEYPTPPPFAAQPEQPEQQYPIPPHYAAQPEQPWQDAHQQYPPQFAAQPEQHYPVPPQHHPRPEPDGQQYDAGQSFQGPPPPPPPPRPAPRHYAGDQQYGPPPQQAPVPRPEDLLAPERGPVTAEPASWGWRGRVNRGTGGMIKTKAAPQEIAAREAIRRIQRGFSRPMTVVVVQPKGGAGKTPTTICLSAAFGAHRGGYVVGWDDNETRGTLAVRVTNTDEQRATVWDLLSDLPAFEKFDARVGDLSHYVRLQPDSHFDALVSDDNPGNMAQIGEDEFHRLHRVLQRFYRLIVVDTGNNVRSPNWQAAVNAADLVVVVSTYQRDVGYSGSWVLDHLAQTGREELARNAVTILSAADPTTDKTVREQLIPHFSARTRAVAEIPYDPQLAHGGPIRWVDLADRTRNAWTRAGALVVDALVEQDQRALSARRE